MTDKILGVGCDIIEIDRFKQAIEKHKQRFLDRLFSKREQEHCLKYNDFERRFAVRFAAKEAVAKALGEGFGKNISFLDIEILNQESGKPFVILSEKCRDHFDNPTFHLSLSHCHSYATATAIAVKS